MRWIKSWLGLSTPLDKKKKELSKLQTQAMIAQRNGDIRRCAQLTKEAEDIEDEIIELLKAEPTIKVKQT